MRRAYLLAYSDTLGTRDQVKKVVDEMPEIITWRYDLPHAFYIISEASAKTIAGKLRTALGGNGRFIITEVADENSWGWLAEGSWYLMKYKTHKPKA